MIYDTDEMKYWANRRRGEEAHEQSIEIEALRTANQNRIERLITVAKIALQQYHSGFASQWLEREMQEALDALQPGDTDS
jgi:hypothetical protein